MAVPDVELHGPRVSLRPATIDDADALARILTEPAVARWWPGYDLFRTRSELPDGWAIEVHGGVVGWLVCEEETEPDYRHVSLDIALTTSLHGQGYGPEALRLAIEHFIARGHHRFTIDPAADNDRAIRAYESLGFKRVGVMRRYERGADGSWHDGLLLDLLAEELK